MKKQRKVCVSEYFAGDEPQILNNDRISIITCLNWYNSEKTYKDSKQYTLDYLKLKNYSETDIEKISSLNDGMIGNLGFVCRIYMNGVDLSIKNINWINTRINELLNYKKSEIVERKIEYKVQDSIKNQGTFYINEIEGHLDHLIKHKKSDFVCYDYIIANNIKSVYLNQIINHYTPLLQELSLVLNGEDDDLKESYSSFKKTEIKNRYNFVNSIIEDCKRANFNTKTTRKPRKKKVITVDKLLNKVKYKKEDINFKIKSVDPVNIIGAKQLWVFNTKYKKLGIYTTNDEKGFVIKGTTIYNIDEENSIQKYLKKPDIILQNVINGGKLELKKLMNNIQTTASNLSGRINDDVILLRVIK